MNELTIDGKQYISSKKAADITGYAKDYVGQLCREGHVEARMVGRSWYVLETSIRAHRFGGDAHAEPVLESVIAMPKDETVSSSTWENPVYVADTVPSMPVMPVVERPMPIEAPDEAQEPGDTAESLSDMQSAWKEWFAQKQDTFIETPQIIDAREEEHDRELEIEENIQAFKETHSTVIEEEDPEDEVISVPFTAYRAPAVVEMPEPVVINTHIATIEEPEFDEIEQGSEPVLIHHSTEAEREEALEEQEVHVPSKKERKQAIAEARKQRRMLGRRTHSGSGSIIVRAGLLALILLTLATTAVGTGFADRYLKDTNMLLPIFDFLGGTSTYTK
ncbi:MAG: hypothetical protein AB203_01945 [Parcubacteria bacterium C7867-008]|nr:MAG: hypothetical protein AB203_01945 [Parcubacteria bacterium C7867-008]